MSRPALLFHSLFWLATFLFWLVASRSNHANFAVCVVSTLVLVTAAGGYTILLATRVLSVRRIVTCLAALVVAGLTAAIVIHSIYDVMVGPDPRRFRFWTNVGMDIAFVLLNTLVAAGFSWLLSFFFDRSTWFFYDPVR